MNEQFLFFIYDNETEENIQIIDMTYGISLNLLNIPTETKKLISVKINAPLLGTVKIKK